MRFNNYFYLTKKQMTSANIKCHSLLTNKLFTDETSHEEDLASLIFDSHKEK